MMRPEWLKPVGILLVVWGLITTTINSLNADYYGLQNATVAALVERGTFALVDQVIPGFNLVEGTETFRYGNAVYPMKQPGGTVWGAAVYWPLYKLGFTYQNHFHYTSHIVTMMTAGLAAAGVATLIYLLTNKSWLAMLAVAGTIIWPYAGVTHHDIMGIFFVTLSLYGFWQKKWLLAGIASTLTWFFTMLPLTWPIVLWILVALKANKRALTKLTGGMFLGLIPTITFNTWVFGKPWLVANLAGKVSDTIPLLSITNLGEKLWFYLGDPHTAFWAFMPILLVGIWGARKQIFLWLPPLLHLLHIASMETFGGYQYGPRYLLPTLPFLMLGIGEWFQANQSQKGKLLLVGLAVISMTTALVGALQTTMYPLPGPYAPFELGSKILNGEIPVFRMFWVGLTLMVFGATIITLPKLKRRH